ncbi:hypothetical protein LPTSP2_39400 [Leptospira ellinghausenii]|uniref:Uncharacterized protein n=1 Tax=Leptospira ellinghausenii TaxID=1917822 RepID=A0A2P2DIZ7_9LEPT|nr:hypothetical protein [Leptospira ellinghausenii]GBF44637.1 hypothetical protein LPTSP2_39400 [Leptospira ellinghausenii]
MIFNIYYINIAKVYEISMMIDNLRFSNITKENIESNQQTQSSNLGFSLDYLESVKSNLGFAETQQKSSSHRIVENIEIITTKSILLRKIISKAKQLKSFANLTEGDLIKIENIKLTLSNELELRQVKTMSNGALNGFRVEGVDISNLINSMLKDYSYVLHGEFEKEKLILKIPMQYEGEFENLYNIDDLTIGHVTLVGIYKKQILQNELKNTFNTMQEFGKPQTENNNKIEKSSTTIESAEKHSENKNKFHFVDTIAIIQDIYKNEEFIEIRKGFWGKFILFFKGIFNKCN